MTAKTMIRMKQPSRSKFHIKVFFLLLALTLALILLHFLLGEAPGIWRGKFNLDKEANVPTWFAAALLLSVAFCALALYRRQDPGRSGRCFQQLFWLGFSIVYVFLSLDEVAGFHELSVHWAEPIRFAIFGLVAFAFLGGSAWYFLVSKRESGHLARWILPGIGVYFLGAIGLEGLNAYFAPLSENLMSLEIIVEETMELLGTAMVLTGCLAEWSRLEAGRLGQILPRPKMPRRCLIQGAAFSLAALALAALVGLAVSRSPGMATIPMLQRRVESARNNKLYDQALGIERILLKRYARQKDEEGIFKLSLDIAYLEHERGNREEANRILGGQGETHKRNVRQTAIIALARSWLQKDEGNLAEAVSLLERARGDGLPPEIFFDISMALAGLYGQAGRWVEAERLYAEMAEMFAASPSRRSSASLGLARVYLKRGEMGRASECLSGVSPPYLNPDLLFQVQSRMAIRFIQEKRYEEALEVYEALAVRLKENPRLFPQIQEQVKILRRKLKRT